MTLRLVFTSDGVGVVIRNVELRHLVKTDCDSAFDYVIYDQVETGSSESQAEGEELNQSQSVGTCIVIGLCFRFCFCFWLMITLHHLFSLSFKTIVGFTLDH